MVSGVKKRGKHERNRLVSRDSELTNLHVKTLYLSNFVGYLQVLVELGAPGVLKHHCQSFSHIFLNKHINTCTQCAGHSICSVMGGPSNTTVSITFALDGSWI